MQLRHITMSITLGAALTLALVMVLGSAGNQVRAVSVSQALTLDHSKAISQALAYIRTQQQPDGGINAFGTGSNPDGSARALLALAASGQAVESMAHVTTGHTLVDYLAAQAVTFTHDASGTLSFNLFPARSGLLLAAVAAADQDPTRLGGMDLIDELNATYHPATGAYSTTARQGWTSGAASEINQAWAILGLSAAGQAVPLGATDFLLEMQTADGSWYLGDPDTSALAAVALLGSGNVQPTDAAIQNALGFFHSTQLPSGGWRPSWDTDPLNADSTAWAIQALVAAGYTPATASWTTSANPHEALLSQQQVDGRIGGTYANAYSTIEALFGLTEQPLFFLGAEHRALRALTWMHEQQNADGSWNGFMGTPDTGGTLDAVLAFASAGFDPHSVSAPGGNDSALDYLAGDAFTYTHDVTGTLFPAQAGKLILGVVAAGDDPRAFGLYPADHGSAGLSMNFASELAATYHMATGAYSTTAKEGWSSGAAGVGNQAWTILGLRAAGEHVPVTATNFLIALQSPDGAWESVDYSGLALQALVAADVPMTHTRVVSGLAFLRAQQDKMGGWGNANSTAFALQGLLAAGENPKADWLKNGSSPYDALAACQKVDGPFVWMWDSPWGPPSDNALATAQAVPALLDRWYPIINLYHAGLVVDYDDGSFGTACVAFGKPAITGLELLDRSGIPYETQDLGWGPFVSSIGGLDCGGDPLCTWFWSYWYQDAASAWQSYGVGAAGSEITDGAIDGWHWTDWMAGPAPAPGITPTLESICGASMLMPFTPINRGADPDRTLAVSPRATWGNSLDVIVPFGSDLNQDANVTLDWRALGGADWMTGTSVYRAEGYYTATLLLTTPTYYELRATFADIDGVQSGGEITDTVSLITVISPPFTVFLPVVIK